MYYKPTYEELERRINMLEQENTALKKELNIKNVRDRFVGKPKTVAVKDVEPQAAKQKFFSEWQVF